jgi:hypothetical protein
MEDLQHDVEADEADKVNEDGDEKNGQIISEAER